MACCIAREIENGELIAQGIATPLVSVGYLLAKHTHAPDSLLLYTIGNTLSQMVGTVSLTNFEATTIGESLRRITFPEISCELLPTFKPKEFFRSAQVDRMGNFNNVVIGDYLSPKIKLPGAAAIPDVTCYYPKIYLYVPRHTRRVFVEKVDFVSGIGSVFQRGNIATSRPIRIITNLCIFDIKDGNPILFRIHPGVRLDEVIENTGFKIEVPSNLLETEAPSEKDLQLLKKMDPFGVRELELLTGDKKLQRIKKIVIEEKKLFKGIRCEN